MVGGSSRHIKFFMAYCSENILSIEGDMLVNSLLSEGFANMTA